MEYTNEQNKAIHCVDKDLVVTAGAGAGKTRVMVDRIIYILREGYATIDELVAITYTNKAALEIKERLRNEIQRHPQEEILKRAGEKLGISYIGTIHSFCLRLLKENPVEAGLDPQIQVLEEARAGALLKKSIEEAIIEKLDLSSVYNLTAEIGYDKLVREIYGNMTKMRNQGSTASDLDEQGCTEDEKTIIMLICDAERIFDQKKADLGFIDYEDILQRTLRMLKENEDILNYYRKKLKFIMVDEYQDLNFVQDKIIRMLGEGTNLFVVGDKKQSIYGFRGARVELFEKLYKDLKERGSAIDLKHNFRSLNSIIDFVNEGFQNLMAEYEPIIPRRRAVKIPKVTFLLPQLDGRMQERRQAEGKMIAAKILEIMADKNFRIDEDKKDKCRRPSFRDFAVLFRKKTHLKCYEEAFKKLGIPYIVADSGGLMQNPRVKNLLNVFRAIKGKDLISLYGILNGTFGISNDKLAVFVLESGRFPGLDEKISFSHKYQEIADAYKKIIGWKVMSKRLTLYEFALKIVRETGLAEMTEDDEIEDIENLMKFLELCRDYDKIGYRLGEFLEEIEDFGEEYKEANLTQVEDDAVRFVTIHSSKGLEFPIVILADASADIDARFSELVYEPQSGLALKKNKQRWDAIKEALLQREVEEAKRLLYVALTRAQDILVISGEAQDSKKESFQKWIFPGEPGSKFSVERLLPQIPASFLHHDHIKEKRYFAKGGFKETHITIDKIYSVTVLGEYLRCPRRYFLNHVAKIPETIFFENTTSTQILNASERGKIIHEFLEQYAEVKFGEKEIQDYIRVQTQRGISSEDAEFIATCLSNYLKLGIGNLPGKVYTEIPYIYRIDENLALTGIIDRAVIDNAGTVIDFKTNAHITDDLLRSYEFQVKAYALGVNQIFGIPVSRAVLVSLQEGKLYEIDVSKQSLDSCKGIIQDAIMEIQSNGFSAEKYSKSLSCQYCVYKYLICQKYN